jgi:hypothetical protein
MLITSSGERNWRLFFLNDLVVTLDGEVQKHVVEADDEAGYVIRQCLDANGKVIRDGLKFWRAKTERVEGQVKLIGTRRYSPDDAKAAALAKCARRAARNLRIKNRADVRRGVS